MWQETRLNFQQGTFGPPQDLESLIMFWTKMAELHYPGAEDTRDEMRRRLEQQIMQQQMMMQQQQAIEEAARQQAARDAGVAPAEDLMPPPDNSLPLPPNMQTAMNNMELNSDRYGGML